MRMNRLNRTMTAVMLVLGTFVLSGLLGYRATGVANAMPVFQGGEGEGDCIECPFTGSDSIPFIVTCDPLESEWVALR